MNEEVRLIGQILYNILEGDDYVDDAYRLLRSLNLVDENHEWICEDE